MQPLERIGIASWTGGIDSEARRRAQAALEAGKILYFPSLAFAIEPTERALFCGIIAKPKVKNITFDPRACAVHGTSLAGPQKARLEAMMLRFAERAESFARALLEPYGAQLRRERTTFRPVEINGRACLSWRKDDSRLHVDAFPSRPTSGRRILRFFANVNPAGERRIWHVGEEFEAFARAFLPRLSRGSALEAHLMSAFGLTKGVRTPYDRLMLALHDACKRDLDYQANAPQEEIAFPAGSAWMCFTDQVLHAALEGRFALEQTFSVGGEAMSDSARTPKAILERLTGARLT